jgi:hypothetical protein
VNATDVLELSDERDRWLRRVLDAERAAYELGMAEGFRIGLERGARIAEAEWPAVIKPLFTETAAEMDLKRYPPAGREHFADPRDGDGRAAAVRRDAYRSGLIPSGKIHLGGAPVHGGHRLHGLPCTAACHAYKAGWYTFAAAARIMATLPDCPSYRREIAELRRLAEEYQAVAA